MIVDFAIVSGASVAALLVVHTITFAIGHRIGRYNVVDVAWGLGFIAVAAVAAVLGTGDPSRRWLLLALVAIWALRLSWLHLPQDRPARARIRATPTCCATPPSARSFSRCSCCRASLTWFISLPLQLSAVSRPHPAALAGRHRWPACWCG